MLEEGGQGSLIKERSTKVIDTVKLGYNEQLGTGHFFRYNRVNLCSKMTNLP